MSEYAAPLLLMFTESIPRFPFGQYVQKPILWIAMCPMNNSNNKLVSIYFKSCIEWKTA